MPQETFLFSDSVRENIAFGVEDCAELAPGEGESEGQDRVCRPHGPPRTDYSPGVTQSSARKFVRRPASHDLYPHSENHEPLAVYQADEMDGRAAASPSAVSPPIVRKIADEGTSGGQERIANLETNVRELREELASVRTDFLALQDRFEDLRRQLGG